MSNKDKTKRTTKQLFVIAFALMFLIVGSYAWLTLQITGDKTNILKAGTLKLTLDDTTSNGILLEKAVPMSDTKGKTTTEYTFTLQNSGSIASDYKIYLDDVALSDGETRLEDSKVKYQLIKNGEETVDLLSNLDNKVIDSGTLGTNKTNTYSLRVWIDSIAENEVMQKILYKELRVEATQTKQTTPTTTAICKRATTLHKETCEQTSKWCAGDGYTNGSEIEYGSLGTEGTLSSGDAFDCDVNGDGEYDPETERFYYVSDATNGITTDNDTAVLIYYNNVSGGEPSNSTSYAYDETNENWHGPVTAIKQLPTTSQWKTTLTNTKRQITTETGSTTTKEENSLSEFSYDGYAARLLTAQEVSAGCGITVGSLNIGELSTKCKYLMENTKYSSASNGTYGGWLETPTFMNNNIWYIRGIDSNVSYNYVSNSGDHGVRPAIEVSKSNISY